MFWLMQLILLLAHIGCPAVRGSNITRLVNGKNSCSGRVEVFYNGSWRTVCYDDWDLQDAAVVCREIGCGNVIDNFKSANPFGQGTDHSGMVKVNCKGNESTLLSCQANELANNNCKHSQYVGVICNANVRLVDGDNPCSGRVEVFNDGQWKRVCYDGWDQNDSKVVCTELGCGSVVDASYAYFGQGSGSMWNHNVQCTGNETTLKSCISNETPNCSDKGAGVICQSPVLLVNGSNSCSGRVEIRYNGMYGTVHGNGWNLTQAAVVCRATGCGDALERQSAANFENYSGRVWMDNVMCNGKESSLLDCAYTRNTQENYSHEKDAVVTCGAKLRLQNGSSSCSGRVEVLHNGTWGTVCDDKWDLKDAEVVCGEIGCGNATEAKTGAFFGQGSGQIWMNNVNCYGNELTLKRCRSSGWDIQNCNHSKDAGVICQHDSSSSTTAKSSSTTQVKPTSAAHNTGSPRNNSSVSLNFIFINDAKSWIDALQHCKTHHKTLAHILNGTAQQYITEILRAREISSGVWIGLERDMCFTCSPWLWTGGPYVDYEAWNKKMFPVDPRSRFCGKLQKQNNTFGWMDACCYEKLPFICQG